MKRSILASVWISLAMLTPSLQYLEDPALNPEQDSIWIFGLRLRRVL